MAEQRQDRRVRRSKAQLRQALIQLLQEKPVEEITEIGRASCRERV